jgi:hypothetical protein
MSLEVECGWTLLRALILALIATPTAALLARSLETASPRSRQWQVIALAIPLLTPGFVVGYSYSNLTLDLVRSPLLNELFYDLLLLFQIVPSVCSCCGWLRRHRWVPQARGACDWSAPADSLRSTRADDSDNSSTAPLATWFPPSD